MRISNVKTEITFDTPSSEIKEITDGGNNRLNIIQQIDDDTTLNVLPINMKESLTTITRKK